MSYLYPLTFCCGLRPCHPADYVSPPVPLTALQISADIQKFLATVSLTQYFRNIEKNPIECEYLFPIDDNGVVTNITIQFDDGTEIIADIQEKKAAQAQYDQAIKKGDSAMLVSTSDPDRLILNIGNLPAGSRAVVRLTYITPLVTSNEHWRFIIPVALTPRYSMQRKYDEGDDPNFTWVRAAECPYNVGFRVSIESDMVIQGIHSPSHSIETQIRNDAKTAVIQLDRTRSYVPDRDFILNFYTPDAFTPRAIVQQVNGRYAAMLSFVPKFMENGETEDDLEGTGEFIFVLDRSGSMSGDRITMAIEAAQLFLKSLPVNSIFNVISFGSQFSSMFNQSVEYNTQTLNTALAHLNTYSADMGGTEICSPLEHIFRQQFSAQHPRTVFLLTDGAVSSPEIVVNLVADNVAKNRVHAIGIGEGVSQYLIKEVAKAGKGTASFVTKNEELKLTVINALKKAVQPSFTNWSVDINGETVPDKSHLSTLYYNEPFVMYAMMNNLKNDQITLTCWNTRYSRRESFSIFPDEIYTVPGDGVHKLWAKHRIADLEREIKRGGRLENVVIGLSMQYKVPSSYTSYIAIERRLDKVHGYMQHRTIPISYTYDSDMGKANSMPGVLMRKSMGGSRSRLIGKHGSGPVLASASLVKKESKSIDAGVKRSAPPQVIGKMSFSSSRSTKNVNSMAFPREESKSLRREAEEAEDYCTNESAFMPELSIPMSPAIQAGVGYMSIISVQEAQGFWSDSSIRSLFSIPAIPVSISSLQDSSTIWATIVALAYLEKDFQDKKGEWELISKKAKRWLKSKGVNEELLLSLISQV